MRAARQGNEEAYKKSMEQWKANDQTIKDQQQFVINKLKEADTDEEMRLKAISLGMPGVDSIFRTTGGAKQFLSLLEKNYNDYEKQLNPAREKIKEQLEIDSYVNSKVSEAIAKNPHLTQAEIDRISLQARGEAKNFLTAGTSMSDTEYEIFKSDPKNQALADAYAKGVLPAELVRGRGRGAGEKLDAIQRLAVERHPDMDIAASQARYIGTKSEQRTLGTQTARLATAGREADNLGDLLLDASDKVPRTNFPNFNEAILAARKGTGDPAVVAYGAALNSYINAYARAINPTGQPRISDKEHAREMLSEAYSKEQIKAVVEQLKKETKQAREAPEFVEKSMRGKESEDIFNDGESKDYPLPIPKNKKLQKGKYYDLSAEGKGVHRYLGNGEFE